MYFLCLPHVHVTQGGEYLFPAPLGLSTDSFVHSGFVEWSPPGATYAFILALHQSGSIMGLHMMWEGLHKQRHINIVNLAEDSGLHQATYQRKDSSVDLQLNIATFMRIERESIGYYKMMQ